MTPSTARRVAAIVRWSARVLGTGLLAYWFRHAEYEFAILMQEKWVYGERMFSIGFLAMMLGLVVGWMSDRVAAGLLIAGYILAVAAPFMGEIVRPTLADNPLAIGLELLPLLVIGAAYAYSGRTRAAFS
ncbi:MAG: hypothetical protein JXB46_06580 [Candidatus Eisenbacteria bacterium]|nr:hypothetical protein [Candidatus Eisenbacteria bacterium]